jgi:hypothetical protein
MPTQLKFNFDKPRDCTPKEQKEWIGGELKYWADIQGNIIIGLSILQVSLLGFMLGMMCVIENTIA